MFKTSCTVCSSNDKTIKGNTTASTYDITIRLVEFLNRHKIRVPPSQVNLYADMLETFAALKGGVEVDDIIYLAKSVFTTVKWTEDLEKEIKEYFIGRKQIAGINDIIENSRIVSRIKFGKNLSTTDLFPPTASKKDLLEYIFLRKIGVIRRDKSGRLKAVRYNEFVKLVKRSKYSLEKISIDDVIKYIPEIPSYHWAKLLTEDILDKASLNQLLKLSMHAAHSRNKGLGKKILTRISRILSEGHHLKRKQRKIVYKLMKHTGYSDDTLLFETMSVSSNIGDAKSLEPEKIVDKISGLPLKERMKIVSKLQKSIGDKEEIFDKFDLITLSSLNSSVNKRLKNRIFLGKALGQLIKYYITGDESYLDYAGHYLRKIDFNNLDPKYKPIYESLLENDFYGALNKLSFQDKQALLEYTIFIARDQNLVSSREELKKALELGYRLLRNVVFRKGTKYEGRKIVTLRGEHVAIRNTIYQFIRFNYKMLFSKKIKGKDIIAVLDTSGSMLPYSLWALMTLAAVIHRVRYVVVFSETPSIIRIDRKMKSVLMNILENILETSFRGYTDIAGALKKTLSLCRNKSIIILISDLKQTLPGNPLETVVDMVNKGHKVIVITHPDHNIDLAHKISSLGVDVIIVDSPYVIPFILKRKLNLKGGVVKESKRLENVWLRNNNVTG